MVLYHRCFNLKELKNEQNSHDDIELNNKVTKENCENNKIKNQVRSFKSTQTSELDSNSR